MMAQGIFVALLVSIAWIIVQNALMHWRPAENRFSAMLTGYVLSLPFVWITYRFLPARDAGIESPLLGLFHAYFFHLLVFLCYGECFYHVERSVTLRLLVELLGHNSLQAIQSRYNVEGMIRERLEVLRDRGFVEPVDDSWRLRSKGAVLARVTVILSRLSGVALQHERIVPSN